MPALLSSPTCLTESWPQMYEQYGEFFIGFFSDRGYGDMLRTLGSTLRDWFSRVNVLHSHLHVALPDLRAPEF